MKIIELAGLSMSAQTTFATAVSEIARLAIDSASNAYLILSISDKKERSKKITATIQDGKHKFITHQSDGYKYAKRLVDNIELSDVDSRVQVQLHFNIPRVLRVDDALLEKWVILFNTDPAVSPYEEIKRKNRQLLELSDKLKESESQYRTLTNSLPLMIFTSDFEGKVTFANDWLREYSGKTVATLNQTNWKDVLHPDEGLLDWTKQDDASTYGPVAIERRLKDARTGEYRWHTGIATPLLNQEGTLQYWTAYLADIHAQKTVEETLKNNSELIATQEQLTRNIADLNRSNQELEQFAYVASHDLQEPLRKIGVYSDYLQRNYRQDLDANAIQFLDNIMFATDRMRTLIHDVLAYSTITRDVDISVDVDLKTVAKNAVDDLEVIVKEKKAEIIFDNLPSIHGSAVLLQQLFENIISNSLKYVQSDVTPIIYISSEIKNNSLILSFKDNGIGFDEKYLDKMFTLFQRLHGRDKYSGAGIGLSICKKIVDIHKGNITANSSPGHGATFIIELPLYQTDKK